MFRVSPNELSFATVTSWKAIYGHAIAGKPTAVKSKFYEMYGAGFNSWCIGSERDPKVHGRMKKLLSHAFSTKALIEQEDIIQSSINAFIDKIGPESQTPKGLNVGEWYQMVAFDILGDMAFGESFHCVENGERDDAVQKHASDDCCRQTALLARADPRASLLHHRRRQSSPLSSFRHPRQMDPPQVYRFDAKQAHGLCTEPSVQVSRQKFNR